MHLKIKPNDQSLIEVYQNHSSYHDGDAGLDLFINSDIVVPAKAISFQINLGISCEAFPDKSKQQNVWYYLYPRSSMGSKTPLRLANSVGIIDSGYRGDLIAIVDNISDQEYRITASSRLFQICSADGSPLTFQVVNTLSETSRGSGGLGSTGASG